MTQIRIEFDRRTPDEIMEPLRAWLREIGVDPWMIPLPGWIEIGSNNLVEILTVGQSQYGDVLFKDQSQDELATGVCHVWREKLPDLTLPLSVFQRGGSSNKRNLATLAPNVKTVD